jgi:hypothetical protein
MLRKFNEIDRLKRVLDFSIEAQEIYDDKYIKSIYDRLYGESSTLTEETLLAASSLPYSLRPKVEIHTKKEEMKETFEEEQPEEKEEQIEEKGKFEIEIIKSEVEEPEFIKIIPKREIKEKVEFPKVAEVKEWESKELPEWRAEGEVPEWVPEEAEVPFTYKGYTLYKRDVEINGGKIQTIYFFSKRKPKSGEPCGMPEGFEIAINKRSGMPYLRGVKKKEKEKYYEKNGYKLYVREVKLRSGKIQKIYFFSKKKPKHGTRCALPEGYKVAINKRSGMPYLKRK